MMQNSIRKFVRDESGQSLTEYAMILTMIAIICIAAVYLIGDTIKVAFYDKISEEYPDGT